jgi:hypothetical protein
MRKEENQKSTNRQINKSTNEKDYINTADFERFAV